LSKQTVYGDVETWESELGSRVTPLMLPESEL